MNMITAKTIVRENCCICGGGNLLNRITIENFPIYMGVTDDDLAEDVFFDQTWVECIDCGCIQLFNLLPLTLIYQSNHHTEVVGQLWKEHHDAFASFISKQKPNRILEIGAAHGYLAKNLTMELVNVEYTIVEPDSNLVSSRIKVISGYIEDHFSELNNKDCIIHSHVLEHVYQPIDFVNRISNHLTIGTDMYISFPNMEGLIRSGGLNSLNFEHTYLLDPYQAEIIFQNAGFKILTKKKYLDHSFFYHLKKETSVFKKLFEFPNIKAQSQEFLNMVYSHKDFVSKTNGLLESHNGPVYLFGAHIFSQSLLFLGLNSEKITGILDNSIGKQNKRLYGTRFKVFNPTVISESENVMIVLNASHYQNEIRDQLLSLNSGVILVENQ
jgi:2-polyprenyl-3-methyl-5-hydroxy-6-metoxy-1,4-benzoquinol methylase